MSKSSDVVLMDGNMPQKLKLKSVQQKELYDEDEEDLGCDSWESIMIVKLDGYTLEYDHTTKELTITSVPPMTVDAIDDDTGLKQVQYCRTLVLRPSE